MEHLNYNISKPKNKHLKLESYYFIQSEYNFYMASSPKPSSKTTFMKNLASKINTSLSNLYSIIKSGLVELRNYDYSTRVEFSATAAFKKRSNKNSNSSKIHKAKEFINLVINTFRSPNNMDSIDEIINHLKLHNTDEISHMTTVCTKTFYNYINTQKIDLKPIELPEMVRRKPKKAPRQPKRHKGTSIDERPFLPDDRSLFGHWEGDLVLGTNEKDTGALFTLLERKTRKQIIIPIKNKTSKQVYMAVNKLEKQYGNLFPSVFKSITFDNGSEFSRYKDIERKPNSKSPRTKVYFAHPYSSWERGSNENGNRLIRRFIKKGTRISSYSNSFFEHISKLINSKSRKVLNYLSADHLFNFELSLLS